ncbi:hypothetical protein FND50_12630 [Rhodococcus sp. WB9]|uniref:hypothetical protein n=1 Tax=Rhodococcus sp. WB9 TaxID=2594007 RepID=UPI001185C93E|nr:hypothetical protein [Rhodococcus sp. WB9]QDQ91579.1 hypothetical protein FND50_12630 [Rhodococcus sp. WB9]
MKLIRKAETDNDNPVSLTVAYLDPESGKRYLAISGDACPDCTMPEVEVEIDEDDGTPMVTHVYHDDPCAFRVRPRVLPVKRSPAEMRKDYATA